jgi:glycine cleavage system H protein
MNYTEKILCSKSHEYLLDNADKTYTVGLTDYAVEQLGDIVFLELPETGVEFLKGETFAAIESVKAASEIYMPISAKVVEINDAAVTTPEVLNEDNYEKGWLVKIEATADDTKLAAEMADLMEYEDYKEEIS